MPQTVTQQEFAAALLEPGATPVGITTARGTSDPTRFAVYRNNVMAGLGKALEQKFPVTARLVGNEFFRGMARAFVAERRPRSALLAEYGDELPAFIESFEAAAPLPYLADVARIEMLWVRAYHAADAAPTKINALAGITAEVLPSTRLARHPAAALLRSAHPAGSIWAAHHRDVLEPVGHPRRETMLIVRPDIDVTVHVLPAQDAAFAEALFDGATLGEAAEQAMAADATFDFGTALVGLIGLGAFSAVATPETRADA